MTILSTIGNALSSQTFVDIAQNTKAAVSIETGLKATGRPLFTLVDPNVPKETRKYSAAKEFLYQALCFVIYFCFIIPVFKKKTFGIFKKHIFKGEKAFENFEKAGEFLDYHKLAEMAQSERIKALENPKKFLDLKKNPKLLNIVKSGQKIDEKHLHLVKGAIEFSSIIGSIVGLTILAPQISHYILHPIMRFIGMEKKEGKSEAPENLSAKNLNKVG